MTSLFHSLTVYNHDEWEQYLERLMILDVFAPLVKSYPNKDDFRCAIHYILYAYSVESDKIILGADWHENKKKIFEFVCMKPKANYYDDFVHLKNQAVLETVTKWVDYQDDPVFKTLQTFKDLKAEMQLTCLTPIKKSSGELDFDQKMKNAEYVLKLDRMIKDMEQELIQNNPKLKDAVKELRQHKKQALTVGPATFAT